MSEDTLTQCKMLEYERESDCNDFCDPEPLEGSFPPIPGAEQEALCQLTMEDHVPNS
jgi:hypothetical protein